MKAERVKRKMEMLKELMAGKKPVVKKKAKSTKKKTKKADMNGDGKVDQKDVDMVKEEAKKEKKIVKK